MVLGGRSASQAKRLSAKLEFDTLFLLAGACVGHLSFVFHRPKDQNFIDRRRTKALLIHPYFHGASFWNYRDACKMLGAEYPSAPLGLITVAAILPDDWDVRLVDCNVRPLADADLKWADVAMLGAMLPQWFDAVKLIARCKAAGVPTVVGGPDPTARPEIYVNADFAVLGEAEGAIDAFLADWEAGVTSGLYRAPKFKIDVTKTPAPRYDLLNLEAYLYVGVQFSRGCPFICEFCDIIELYGRVPRAKDLDQVLNELDGLYSLGYRGHVDFVDDNLIGNKKALKQFLPRLIEWQHGRGYPFEFSTEASLNLADDEELLSMMADARFFVVFIGIESPDDDVLTATLKKQNVKRDIAENVQRIYAHGIAVTAGFIVGFDSERDSVAAATVNLIEAAAIPIAMTGLLYALPDTQLSRRLAIEGRLHQELETPDGQLPPGDQCTAGLNFETLRPREEVLTDYATVVRATFEPRAFFGRVQRAGAMLRFHKSDGAPRISLKDLRRFVHLAATVTARFPEARMHFWGLVIATLLRNPTALKTAITMAALYTHFGPFSRFVAGEIDAQIARIEAGTQPAPVMVSAIAVE